MRATQKTFLITRVSSGFGRAFAEEALHAGHRVIGTVRRPEDAAVYEALDEANAVAKLVEMTDEASIAAMVGEVEREYGPIDILIANAGYGHEGMFEESSFGDSLRSTSSEPSRSSKRCCPQCACAALVTSSPSPLLAT
jgi:NAD(P)-dependent dehydrogenase (short-subunit alcohol dehydrogenase family)